MKGKLIYQNNIKISIIILMVIWTITILNMNIVGMRCFGRPPETYGKFGYVLFSGQNHSGIIACPWLLNETDLSVIKPNQVFREYFNEALLIEIAPYPWISPEFNITYEDIWHEFNLTFNGFWNDTDRYFDPYYAKIEFNYERWNETTRDLWTEEVVPTLISSLLEKWFIDKIRFVRHIPMNGTPGFQFSDIWNGVIFILIPVLLAKKRLNVQIVIEKPLVQIHNSMIMSVSVGKKCSAHIVTKLEYSRPTPITLNIYAIA